MTYSYVTINGQRVQTAVAAAFEKMRAAFKAEFGLDLLVYYGSTLDRLVDQRLLTLEGDRLRLTSKGLPLANRVMAELV